MNTKMIARYLQFLRKSNHDTQEDFAKKLGVSRQAVSRWETGTAIPDLEILLQISRLYEVTINDILEPEIQPRRITDFEQIAAIPKKELREALEQFDPDSLVIAFMGASPEANRLFEKLFPDIDCEMARERIGRVRVETVADLQNQIVSMINLQAADGEFSYAKSL